MTHASFLTPHIGRAFTDPMCHGESMAEQRLAGKASAPSGADQWSS